MPENIGAAAAENKTTIQNVIALLGAATALVVAITGLVKACNAEDSASGAKESAQRAQTNAQAASSVAAKAASSTQEIGQSLQPIASAVRELQAKGAVRYSPSCDAGRRVKGAPHCPGTSTEVSTRLCAETIRQQKSTGDSLAVDGKQYTVEAYPESNSRFWGIWSVSDKCKAADCSCE
jgi:hypothetical protein